MAARPRRYNHLRAVAAYQCMLDGLWLPNRSFRQINIVWRKQSKPKRAQELCQRPKAQLMHCPFPFLRANGVWTKLGFLAKKDTTYLTKIEINDHQSSRGTFVLAPYECSFSAAKNKPCFVSMQTCSVDSWTLNGNHISLLPTKYANNWS